MVRLALGNLFSREKRPASGDIQMYVVGSFRMLLEVARQQACK